MTPPENDMIQHVAKSIAELRDEMREDRREATQQRRGLHRKIDAFIQTAQATCATRGAASAVVRAELTTHLMEHQQRPERTISFAALIIAALTALGGGLAWLFGGKN